MTYRFDSDIRWDYGKIFDIKTHNAIAPSENPKWLEPDDDFYGKLFSNKMFRSH